jgi:TRAP-type transport system small permease protein
MKVVNWASNVLLYLGVSFATILMLLTVADVAGRYLFNHPILGVTEITQYVMVVLLFGMAPCALAGRHVKIDIFFARLSRRTQAVLDCIYYVIGLGVTAFLSASAMKYALRALSFNSASSMLHIPDFPFILLLSVSYAVFFLFIIVLLVKRIGEVRE